jgi:group I intron endonuclease
MVKYEGIETNYFNCVYVFINTQNNKKYVGQAVDFRSRYRGHIYDARNPKREDYYKPFHNALRKYGEQTFEIYILKHNLKNQEEMNYWERYYIKEYNTLVLNNKGYNVSDGGTNGNPLSGKTKQELDEINNKRRKAMLGTNNPFYGKTHTTQAIEKIREANIGRKRESITEETRNKLAKARGGGKIGQYSLNGELIAIWDYISQASRSTGINRTNISNCCNNNRKTAGGFVWKYIE